SFDGAYISVATPLNDACFAGHCDWRMPTLAELQTLLAQAYPCGSNPCVDPLLGPTQDSIYWSSTPYIVFDGTYWAIDFNDGTVGAGAAVADTSYVRAVRGGY